uniref:Epoxyqueuosine reductase n=1 Tax=candidate division WOR-3 bacterium TaxID=2052148 RepID=A0A7C6ECA0_UNCW3
MVNKENNFTQERLEKLILDSGADLFGVADLANVKTDDFLLDSKLIAQFTYALSIAKRISSAVLEAIVDHPTKLYFHHYRMINLFLDQLAIKIASAIEQVGYWALPIPASQIVDWQNQKAHLSHKRIAEAAGLGWIGRNNLLVTPNYGAQVRLVTILTNMPMPNSEFGMQQRKACDPIFGSKAEIKDCGNCYECIKVCPAQAIKEKKEDFDHIKCFEKLKEFQKKGYTSQYICGICVKACKPRKLN